MQNNQKSLEISQKNTKFLPSLSQQTKYLLLSLVILCISFVTFKPENLQIRNTRSVELQDDLTDLMKHFLKQEEESLLEISNIETLKSRGISLEPQHFDQNIDKRTTLHKKDFLDGSLPWWTEWNTLQSILHPQDPAYKLQGDNPTQDSTFGFFPTNAVAGMSLNGSPETASLLSAPTPPMGWNSWNTFRCNVTESQIRQMVDAMVARGLTNLGYEYVIIDDCWTTSRDKDGKLLADVDKFPSGIKALSDYVHARGMKLGIYSNSGPMTCLGNPGSLNFEAIDSQTWSDWGIDFLKYDNCYTNPKDCPDCPPAKQRFIKMGKELANSSRPIVYSIVDWGTSQAWKWSRNAGATMYRTTNDVCGVFVGKGNSVIDSDKCNVVNVLDQQAALIHHSGPGHWGDLDVLMTGNTNDMTIGEQLSQLVLWSALKSPLMISADLRNVDDSILSILSHEEILAINQDPMGIPVRLISRWIQVGDLPMDKLTIITYDSPQKLEISGKGSWQPPPGSVGEVWMGPLSEARFVVVILNRSNKQRYFSVKLDLLAKDLNYYGPTKTALLETGLFVRDVIRRKDLGIAKKNIGYDLPPHHSAMLILSNPGNVKFSPPTDSIGVDWWTCLPGYNLPVKMSSKGHPSCMSLGDGCHFLPDEITCKAWAKHPPPQAMEFSCGPQHLAKYKNNGYAAGTWCNAARNLLWINPGLLPKSMIPDYTCLQSCGDKGHFVRVVDKSGPNGITCLGNTTIDDQGIVTSRCSWFTDDECQELAPYSSYPTQGVANGVSCPSDPVGGWCLIAKQQMRSNWPEIMSKGPKKQDCVHTSTQLWQCVQSCNSKGYFLKARDVGGYGSSSLTCQVYPSSPLDCVFYYDSKCSIPLVNGNLSIPSDDVMTGRFCSQTERGWCKDLLEFFRQDSSVVRCPINPIPLKVVQDSGVALNFDVEEGVGSIASVKGYYDDGNFYVKPSE